MTCEFCRPESLRQEEAFLLETNHWIVFTSYEQSYLGRSFVVLKRHCPSFSEVTEEELVDFLAIVKKFEATLRKAFDARMFNWGCLLNDAYQNNPPNPHVHWHVRPRYDHSVEFAGQIFMDPDFGHHYNRDRKQKIEPELQKQITERIKNCL